MRPELVLDRPRSGPHEQDIFGSECSLCPSQFEHVASRNLTTVGKDRFDAADEIGLGYLCYFHLTRVALAIADLGLLTDA